MASRSRTGLFLACRNSAPRLSHHSSLSSPPPWAAIAIQVPAALAHTRHKIAALDRLHQKHLLPAFADRSLQEHEIDALTSDITREFRRCHALIRSIPSALAHSFPPSNHDHLAAKNVQRALAAQVQDLSASFRKKQRVYMDKLQGHAIKNQDLLVASGAVSLTGSDGLDAVDDDVQAALVHAAPLLDLRARNRELTEIANNIAALAELFKDLSVLVIDQGTLLDSVEYNIEQTATHMQDAVTVLNVATRYQKNTGRRKCIFLLLLIIFGLILVLIFKPKRHAPPPPPPPPSASA
ncbi:hypothetical protein APHAL10511_004926 [Amanita phalloides]|nr:hypothetical protein APHAL10511_004926 [Amanita phalloides]